MKKVYQLFIAFMVVSLFFACATEESSEESSQVTVVEVEAEKEPLPEPRSDEAARARAEDIVDQVVSEEIAEQQDPRPADLVSADLVSPSDSQDAVDAYNEGCYYLNELDYENAEKAFLKAVELDSGFIDAIDNLGVVYRRLGRFEEAEQIYLKSISMSEGNDVPYTNLALVYIDQQRYQEALDLYLELLDKMPQSVEGNYGLGTFLLQCSYYENALYYLGQALQIYLDQESPYAVDAMRCIGLCYFYLNDFENAKLWSSFVLSYIPDDEIALNLMSQME